MTQNKIQREVTDPMWSGRLVQGCDRGWLYEDCTLEHLISHLDRARQVATKARVHEKISAEFEGHGVIASIQMVELAELFELVDSLQRYLPWVMAACVGYERPEGADGTPAHFEVVSAHRTIDRARQWMHYHQKLMSGLLVVKEHPVPVLSVFDPRAQPDRFAGDWVD